VKKKGFLLKQLEDEDMARITKVEESIDGDVPIKGEGNLTPKF
jgi:hypothetical protein